MNPELRYLIEQGEMWIREQRSLHRPCARALTAGEVAVLRPFFGPEVLREVRLRAVAAIQNPDFYRALEALGRPVPMDFSTAHGITFYDTVLLSEQSVGADGPPLRLLFHELVHVVQYQLLGVDGFAHRYVTGWAANGFQYEAIPLERDAYELDGRFQLDPDRSFSVEAEVTRRFGNGRAPA